VEGQISYHFEVEAIPMELTTFGNSNMSVLMMFNNPDSLCCTRGALPSFSVKFILRKSQGGSHVVFSE
jgi:hypothetical protein